MTSDPWDRSGDNHAVALIISNAYRARHGMQPLGVHATVDEDIADAILSSDWLARVKAEAAATALEEAAESLGGLLADKTTLLRRAADIRAGSER